MLRSLCGVIFFKFVYRETGDIYLVADVLGHMSIQQKNIMLPLKRTDAAVPQNMFIFVKTKRKNLFKKVKKRGKNFFRKNKIL